MCPSSSELLGAQACSLSSQQSGRHFHTKPIRKGGDVYHSGKAHLGQTESQGCLFCVVDVQSQ